MTPATPGRILGDDRRFFANADEGDGWELRYIENVRWGLLWSKAIYEFSLLQPSPLTWRDEAGWWRPDQHEARTDLGSIPPPLRGALPHDQFPRSYVFHDSAWRHGGLWFAPTIFGPWGFCDLTKCEANAMLRRWVHAEGARAATWPIWLGVSIGALL